MVTVRICRIAHLPYLPYLPTCPTRAMSSIGTCTRMSSRFGSLASMTVTSRYVTAPADVANS